MHQLYSIGLSATLLAGTACSGTQASATDRHKADTHLSAAEAPSIANVLSEQCKQNDSTFVEANVGGNDKIGCLHANYQDDIRRLAEDCRSQFSKIIGIDYYNYSHLARFGVWPEYLSAKARKSDMLDFNYGQNEHIQISIPSWGCKAKFAPGSRHKVLEHGLRDCGVLLGEEYYKTSRHLFFPFTVNESGEKVPAGIMHVAVPKTKENEYHNFVSSYTGGPVPTQSFRLCDAGWESDNDARVVFIGSK